MIRTRVRTRSNSRGLMAARLLVFTGALAGLFAMHGLSNHGVSSHDVHAAMRPAVMEISHAGHASGPTQPLRYGSASAGAEAPGEDSPAMVMAGLCLAVMVGGIIGFLLLGLHRELRSVRPPVHTQVSARPFGRRDRDPPCLLELSVLRT